MIRLYKNNAYKWHEIENVYTIGSAFYQNKLYKDNELTRLIIELKDNIIDKMQEMTGYFAIVIHNEKETILISDIIRSFPLFYTKNGDVTDDIKLLKGQLDELSLQEILHCRWVSCDDTIYKDVKQLENAQIVIIKNNEIYKQKYFEYEYKNNQNYTIEQLDKVYENMTRKLITFLDGRTAVFPLSGGHDSRLLLYYLVKNNYKNIIAYTYGNKNAEEVKVSKRVAEFLKVKWYFVEYTKKNCRKKYNNKKSFSEMVQYLGRGYSVPHIQEWEAIDFLLKNKKIDENCVIVPGFGGFLKGSHLYPEYLQNEKISANVIKEKIYDSNYNLTKKDNTIFDQKLEKKFMIQFRKQRIEPEKVANFQEKYDFEERQAKFIINAARIYDYYGLQWYAPYFDKNVIDFWTRVSLQDRNQLKFFKNFVNYKYHELMEYAPKYEEKEDQAKMNLFQKINRVFYLYNHEPLNYFYYFKYLHYLKYAIFEKNLKYDYYIASDYVKYLRRNSRNGI